uniref:aminotransferase class I/II-fold pyridoxal phosphate-dependent enzyme n=1 Tax=uncultured Bacteroides sp. TaxID=162156 RepID=UPI00280AE5D7|nr:aminotransferase class I/II-fold pyridoxal phosphate-dependent enzyme [uncultured Bacteroides sp.]
MQAVILAAGMGKRLGALTKNNTKCMVMVDGVPLIDRVLKQLSSLSLNKVILVIGYKGMQLKEHIGDTFNGLPIEYVENPIYDKTNNIYSLSLVKDELKKDDTLLLESDLIFDDSLLRLLMDSIYPNVALVDKYETWMDGTMVRLDEGNNIVNFIPKKDFRYEDVASYYKTVNIYRFSKEFLSTHYVPFLEAYTKALGNNEYYEQVLRVITLLDNCELKALVLTGQKWYEIDDVQDLDIAEVLFTTSKKQLSLYQKRYGGYWRFPNLLDFCYLVNPYFPPAKMKEELKANFDILLTEYPSGMSVNNLLMGKFFDLKTEYVCVGNGAAELIKSLLSNMEGRVGVVYPTFEEYPNRYKKEIIVYSPTNPDFSYTVSDLKEYFSDKSLSALLLINPDNPSGNYISKADVLSLIEWAEKRNITLILDESFVDFTNDSFCNSLLSNEILETFSNLVVIKSISKSYGVPGLRLGIAATSDNALLERIKHDLSIWNINSFAEFYMQISGKYESVYKQACLKFIQERERFYQELLKVSFLRVIPSQANYFLCEVIDKYTSTNLTALLLERYNILIKDCSHKKGFDGQQYIRLAIRNKEDNDKLIISLSNL